MDESLFVSESYVSIPQKSKPSCSDIQHTVQVCLNWPRKWSKQILFDWKSKTWKLAKAILSQIGRCMKRLRIERGFRSHRDLLANETKQTNNAVWEFQIGQRHYCEWVVFANTWESDTGHVQYLLIVSHFRVCICIFVYLCICVFVYFAFFVYLCMNLTPDMCYNS